MGLEVEMKMENGILFCDNIAILLATYNGCEFIEEQIESLLSQTFQDWTLFIHDDGSTDGTVEIIKRLEKRYQGKIVLLPGPSTGGAKNNFMYLLNSVEAPYIMFCDQDDIWLPNKIELTYKRMREIEDNRPTLVFTDLQVVDRNLNVLAQRMSQYQRLNIRKRDVGDFLAENVITGCTMMINKSLAELSRKVSDYSSLIMHDWWIAIVASKFGNISCVEKPLIQYRQHGVNSIGAKKFGKEYIIERFNNKKSIQKALEATRIQAKQMATDFSLDSDDIIAQYARISEQSKIRRLQFYIKNHINKSGLIRNLGLYIWG